MGLGFRGLGVFFSGVFLAAGLFCYFRDRCTQECKVQGSGAPLRDPSF